MQFLDTLVDSKAKRTHLFYLLSGILAGGFLITMFFLGSVLIVTRDASALLQMVQSDVMQISALARLAVSLMNKPSLDISTVILAMIDSIGMLEWLLIIAGIIGWKAFWKKRSIRILIALTKVEAIGIAILLYLGLTTQMFHDALMLLHICGIWMMILSFIQFLIIEYCIWYQLKAYYHALQYQVIETTSIDE